MTGRMSALFASRGLPPYNPHPERVPNSLAALRLGELARATGHDTAWNAGVLEAYWAQGRDIGDAVVLRELAREIGLDATEVGAVLGSSRYLDVVHDSTRRATALGVTGVPAFLLGRRLLVVGAQGDEVFERAIALLTPASAGSAASGGSQTEPA